jgi:hypothetical protein
MAREAHMNAPMILLRAVDGSWEAWRCMPLDEFLRRLDLRALQAGQQLVGTVLPPVRRRRAT